MMYYNLFYIRCGGEECHKPAGVGGSAIQELQRPVERARCYQIIKAGNLRYYKGSGPSLILLMLPVCHHMDVLISRGIQIKIKGCNLAL